LPEKEEILNLENKGSGKEKESLSKKKKLVRKGK
jgi:hypothetical protein